MRWGLFAIILTAAWLVQTTLLPRVGSAWLDLLLVLALVCGMAMPVAEARLAAWITGFAQDLSSVGPIGLHACVLALAGLTLTHLREWVNQNVWWARWVIAFVVALPAQFVIQLHLRFLQNASLAWGQMLGRAFVTSLIASLLAALVLGLPVLYGSRRRRSVAFRA